jgi:hypothetical protein
MNWLIYYRALVFGRFPRYKVLNCELLELAKEAVQAEFTINTTARVINITLRDLRISLYLLLQ